MSRTPSGAAPCPRLYCLLFCSWKALVFALVVFADLEVGLAVVLGHGLAGGLRACMLAAHFVRCLRTAVSVGIERRTL